MIGKTVIAVQGLGKRYRIGTQQPYRTLRDALAAASPLGWRRGADRKERSSNTLWALRDISFAVQGGEVLGVIGANGAGKSTLLKILSRITEPTEGWAQIRGRVGSLLEVGTGFHPELTGRENVYLSGAILGMKWAEISRRFDEIVNFAGVNRFAETPVKHYSSGMYLRLAFSVAAHLLTEVLLVDEVLAVGDAAFQLQCLNKMSEVAGGGKTILFVSHNMETITKLCSRAILLEEGRLVKMGSPRECIDHYLLASRERLSDRSKTMISLQRHPCRTKPPDGSIHLTSLGVRGADGQLTWQVSCGEAMEVVLGFEVAERWREHNATFVVTFSNLYNHRIASCRSHDTRLEPVLIRESGTVRCRIPRLPLVPGLYRLTVACNTDAGYSDGVYDAAVIEVVGNGFYPSGSVPRPEHGAVLFEHEWAISVGAEPLASTEDATTERR